MESSDGGLPARLTPHHLRHTCASLLIANGASVKAVQQQLGHSSPTVTLNVYAHLFDDDLDQLFDGLEEPLRTAASPDVGNVWEMGGQGLRASHAGEVE